MGLAAGRWHHYAGAWRARSCAMTGLGTLGHQAVGRHRSDFLRRRVDRAGTWRTRNVTEASHVRQG
jgi:hypothetical protein